ncbi:6796_t:CDS:2, partial [Diversispora eburnea]
TTATDFAVRIFDSCYLKLSLSNRDIQKYSSDIPQLLNPSIELLQEWFLYCNFELIEVDHSNFQIFWKKMASTFPLLS